LKSLDSGFRRNDRKDQFLTFYEFINIQSEKSNQKNNTARFCLNFYLKSFAFIV